MDTNDLSVLIIQLGVGLTFAAHGAQKLFGWWDGPGREGWLQAVGHMGFRPATFFAPAAAFAELGGGLLLAAGLLTPFAAATLADLSRLITCLGSVLAQLSRPQGSRGVLAPVPLGGRAY